MYEVWLEEVGCLLLQFHWYVTCYRLQGTVGAACYPTGKLWEVETSCDVEVDEGRVDAFLTKSRHYVICEHMQRQGLEALAGDRPDSYSDNYICVKHGKPISGASPSTSRATHLHSFGLRSACL